MIHHPNVTFRHAGPDDKEAVEFALWRAAGSPRGATVRVPNTLRDEDLAHAASLAGAIILEFPSFVDGRAYSQARMLRERHGFRGDLRASGNVLRDQILFMARCGFTSFDADDAITDRFAEAMNEFTYFYQPAADEAPPAWRLRADRARAA